MKNIKKSGDKILLSYRIGIAANFYVKINDKQRKIKELVYMAFLGNIPEGYEIYFIDNNYANINVKNLIAEPKRIQNRKRPSKYKKKEVKKQRKVKRPSKIVVELNEQDKHIQLKEMKKLRKEGYILASSYSGMIYKFRLKNTLCPL